MSHVLSFHFKTKKCSIRSSEASQQPNFQGKFIIVGQKRTAAHKVNQNKHTSEMSKIGYEQS